MCLRDEPYIFQTIINIYVVKLVKLDLVTSCHVRFLEKRFDEKSKAERNKAWASQ